MRSLRCEWVQSPGVPRHLAMICPTCKTICGLYFDGKKVWWRCGTLDCGFWRPFTGTEIASKT